MFVLSRKNQKGQVAIFVALIFQVVFVFFALLINVGLLVHHKINLQQSTDLAAYYGAMKQAESLNAIAHINFQIRQAWKLLTWRYRVVGSFGNDKWGTDAPGFPLTVSNDAKAVVTQTLGKCLIDGEQVNTTDLPFFCIGHAGMKGWPGLNENNCRFSCKSLAGGANTINKIPNVGGGVGGWDTGTAGGINTAINASNLKGKQLCEKLGAVNMNLLAAFILGYFEEQNVRSQTLLMLAANLSKENSESIVDLDGKLIFDGVKKTLKNNLTEANLSSLNDSKIKIFNGLSHDKCRIQTDPQTAGEKASGNQFLRRIEFSFVQLYLQACEISSADNNDYKPTSMFDKNTGQVIESLGATQSMKDIINTLEAGKNSKFTVGYEKDPWCESYYSVKAESEPKIPFLPISKIKLTAVSTAKPFGGSIGPWFGNEWASGQVNSQVMVGTNKSKQVDQMLPYANQLSTTGTIADSGKMTLNFSRFVGDEKGLSDAKYLAEYHAALVDKKPMSGTVSNLGSNKPYDSSGDGLLKTPELWPAMDSWKNVYGIETSDYDPLMKDGNNDSYLRDLEISAISPNQFDLAYYSIDPDFYNNYYKRLSDSTIFNALKNSAGVGPKNASMVRPDFGNNKNVYPKQPDFSVRHQIQITATIFKPNISPNIVGTANSFLDSYPELAQKQSSLLTGWTFYSLNDYAKFPDADVNNVDGAMSFGRCRDAWHGNASSPLYNTPSEVNGDNTLPPTPGNCVTGGRVGYSVKLVSPSLLRGSAPPQPLGGPNTSGQILNPIPDSFFAF